MRLRELKARIASDASDHFPKCVIIGCGQPTPRAEKVGLGIALCRKHQRHRQRHGSPICASPSAKLLKPYLRAANYLIRLKDTDPYVSAARAGLLGLMATAGPVEIATRLRGLLPAQRARVALARLREAGVMPERLLAIAVAVHALIEDNPTATHRISDWTLVAIAKSAHRLSSGTHIKHELRDDSGKLLSRTALHAYPRSSGRVLRHLGRAIENQCEWVIDRHLAEVVALKNARETEQTGAP